MFRGGGVPLPYAQRKENRMSKIAPYGTWKSPITSDRIVSETIGLGQIALENQDTYWVEIRPAEAGRSVIVRRTGKGEMMDLTPCPFNARTRVHEYGGGDFAVSHGRVYFSNFIDQRLYSQDPGAEPRPVTEGTNRRYADGLIDRRRNRMICVCEDHSAAGREVINLLLSLPLAPGQKGEVLVSGSDFYSSPRLHPEGTRLAWLAWNHPNMPWDGTELWIGELNERGMVSKMEQVAGGPDISIFQPEWSPGGTLYFVSDQDGWWNLYRIRKGRMEQVVRMEAEFGMPQWAFGMSTYTFQSENRILCAYNSQGTWQLADLDPGTGRLKTFPLPYTEVAFLRSVPGRAVFVGASPVEPRSIVQLDLRTEEAKVFRCSSKAMIDPGYLSLPEKIEFPTEAGLIAHAFFYAPKNREYAAPSGERPPLLIFSHGGPTAATTSTLNLAIQYWTSRGMAVADVNYGGSTGYGRLYRRRLEGQWGIVDVDDCVNCARYLVEGGQADPDRLVIRGGSAGGYTTLCALTFRDLFRAGASHFGVSDLEALVRDTHKFESRYLDRLIGPYPDRKDLYRQRSPIHFVERLSCPVIFFQGLEDKIVPPDQAEKMAEALRTKGLPVAYVPFAGEQHGFRQAEHIKRALDAELYFYSRIFGFNLPDPVEPVEILNFWGKFKRGR